MKTLSEVTLVRPEVTLAPLRREHAAPLAAAANESRATYGFTIVPKNKAEMEAMIETALAEKESGASLPFVVLTALNTAAKLLLCTHAFETWRVRRVMWKTDERNLRSRAAIERLGARFDGILRANRPAADGGVRDTAYYSMIASEWPRAKERLVAMLAPRHVAPKRGAHAGA